MVKAGGDYGSTLLWVLLLSCLFSFVLMEAYGRYAVVTGKCNTRYQDKTQRRKVSCQTSGYRDSAWAVELSFWNFEHNFQRGRRTYRNVCARSAEYLPLDIIGCDIHYPDNVFYFN